MEKSTYRPDKTTQFGTVTCFDVSTIIPRLIQDLESDNNNLHAPALRQLLQIILDNGENKDLTSKYKLMILLNKFVGNVEKNEEFVLSTTIQHVIGIRNGSDNKMILAGAAIDSIILSLFSSDEKTSKSGSKALCELIGENKITRNSLITTGFIMKVQHAFTHSSQFSSSLQTERITPNHVKSGLLDVLLRLVETVDDLQPIVILSSILSEIKNNGEKEIQKKSVNILGLLTSKGIKDSYSDSKEKDEKIQQLEESNRNKDEENNALNTENLKLLKEIEKIKLEYPQVIPHEFNVVNSLTGLGPDILTDLLSEMLHIEDVIQLVGVNKKTLNLKIHPRFIQILEQISRDKDYPIAIHNPDPRDIELSDVDATTMRISKKQKKHNTFSLTQVLEKGIWQLETEFNNSQNAWAAIGIVRDSYIIPANATPGYQPHTQNMAVFIGKGWSVPQILYKGSQTFGMSGFGDNQILRLEFDSEKGTLFLFVDKIQQQLSISGIKEKIYMYYAGSQCTIRSLKKLYAPTSSHVPDEIAVEW